MIIDFWMIFNGLLQGIIPVLKILLVPIILWILIPGMITQVLFRSKAAYNIGAFVGLVAFFKFGIN
jgi:hypothetical protein